MSSNSYFRPALPSYKQRYMLNDFVSLLFPRVCSTCGTPLIGEEQIICLHCKSDLPYARFGAQRDSPLAKLFWGRLDLDWVTSGFIFERESKLQKLIHDMKYRGSADTGLELGKMLGTELINNKLADSDVILPIPIHNAKKRVRGYNQAELIANGVGEVLGIEVRNDVLVRKQNTGSQTKKGRISRWQDLQSVYGLKKNVNLNAGKVLLIDDVITTGATIEACAKQLLQFDGVSIRAASLAYAA